MVKDLVVDLFCGAGGTAEGVRRALGRSPDFSVNHNEHAIAMHAINHPKTEHMCGDVFASRPQKVAGGRAVGVVTPTPDCRHFSRAKGSPKVSPRIRMLARAVIPWVKTVRPEMVLLENVWEFTGWGPLMRVLDPKTGEWFWAPNPKKKGTYFQKFVQEIRAAGYSVDWRELNAADYGAPTARKRFFLVARRDGQPIQWPEPTHGPTRARPWRTAAECVDWSIPMRSIFDRPRPLAEATQRRIAHGFVRYALGLGFQPNRRVGAWVERMNGTAKGEDLNAPLSTVTSQGRHHGLCLAIDQRGSRSEPVWPLEVPLSTLTTKARHGLVEIKHDPAWIAKNYTGVVGQQLEMPLGTVTGRDHHSLCVAQTQDSWMIQTGNGERLGQAPRVLDLHQPLGTVVAGGVKHALCQAAAWEARQKRDRVIVWVERYYSNGGHSSSIDRPLPTATTKARFALVVARIEELEIVDILFRMFQPMELAVAMGFEGNLILIGTKEQQIERIGNAVCPQVPDALIRANMDAFTSWSVAA